MFIERYKFWKQAIVTGIKSVISIAGVVTVLVGGSVLTGIGYLVNRGVQTIAVTIVMVLAYILLEGAYLTFKSATVDKKSNAFREEISLLYEEGHDLKASTIKDEDRFNIWKLKVDKWTNHAYQKLLKDSGAMAVQFKRPGAIMAAEIIGSFNEKHNDMRLLLDKRLEYLAKLMDK